MKEIKLTKGYVAFVDDEDYDFLMTYHWYFVNMIHSNASYAFTTSNGNGNYPKAMHRIILGINDDRIIDHINRNGLDNRKNNLRIVTKQQNMMNSPLRKNNTSGYKGVSFKKDRNKYVCYIGLNGKYVFLGSFDDPIDAAKKYDEAVRNSGIEYAYTNFPIGDCE